MARRWTMGQLLPRRKRILDRRNRVGMGRPGTFAPLRMTGRGRKEPFETTSRSQLPP